MENKNRLLLYVHFNRNDQLSEHVLYQLQQLRHNFEEIYFISNSKLTDGDFVRLTDSKLADGFLQRENVGYDFAAWAEAMKHYGFDKLANYDSVTIMNDTCFGPVYDFSKTIEQMESDNQIDFWGITNNRSHKVKPWEDKEAIVLPDHIQSYFVSYKQKVVQSTTFQKFWSGIEILDDVVAVIIKYETAMTKYFEDAGFKSAVLFDTRKEDWAGMVVHDFSVFNLPELLRRKIPFLKIKAFSYGAEYLTTPLVVEQLKASTLYPIRLLIDHMTDVDYPDRAYMLDEKMLTFNHENISNNLLKIAIHLHANHLELIPEYFEYFNKYVQDYELYITTDSQEKKVAIEQTYPVSQLKSVILTESDEILSWWEVASEMEQFDLVGHFCTQRNEDKNWLFEEVQQREIKQVLLKPAQEIFQTFKEDSKLGLLVTDVPTFYQQFKTENLTADEIWGNMAQIWQKIEFRKDRDLKRLSNKSLKYATMVWYRPQALYNLLKIDIKELAIDSGVLIDEFLPAFERLLVYVSWTSGYDFRVSPSLPKERLVLEQSDNQVPQILGVDFEQIRLRKLLKETLRKVKKIITYRFKFKK